jgi:hypothetical protein
MTAVLAVAPGRGVVLKALSSLSAQHFLSMHGAVALQRHLVRRSALRLFRAEAAQAWKNATVAA